MKFKSTITGYPNRIVAATAIAGFAAMVISPVMAHEAKPMDDADSAATAALPNAQESDLRLSLDKADLAAQSGRIDEAYDMIENLKQKYPNNPDVIAAETDLGQMRAESRSVTFSDVCAPVSLNDNALDLLENEQRLMSGKHGFGCVGYNRRITNQAVEQIENATGQVAIPYQGLALNFDLENDHVNTSAPFTRSNGTTQGFYGLRQQGTLMLQKSFTKNAEAGFSVYGDNAEAGAGGQFVFNDKYGSSSISGVWNKPDWDYVETIVEDGVKTGGQVERKEYFTQDLQATLAAGWYTYSLHDTPDAAYGPGWNFGLDYSHPIKLSEMGAKGTWYNDELTFGAHYGVDAQYLTHVTHGLDNQGDNFHALPSTSYEVHSFTVSLGKSFFKELDAEIDGGYGVDRWTGNNGPLYGAQLTWTPLQHLGVDVHASRTLLGGQNNGGKEDIEGASLKWIW